MGTAYYYLMATLPALRWGDPPPFSTTELLARSEPWISEEDHAALIAATRGDEAVTGIAAGDRWWRWEKAFRRALAGARAQRLGVDSGAYADIDASLDLYTRAQVQECVKQDDPLKAEQALDQARWVFLEELGATQAFTFDALLGYLLRLGILERWSTFDAARGADMLERSITAGEPASR